MRRLTYVLRTVNYRAQKMDSGCKKVAKNGAEVSIGSTGNEFEIAFSLAI